MPDQLPLSAKYDRESIMDSMMQNWDNRFDKRKGGMVYDACIAAANELAQCYLNLEDVESNQFPDTADRESLLLFAREQGVGVEFATPVLMRGVFNAGAQVQIGSRFNRLDGNFVVIRNYVKTGTTLIVPNEWVLQSEATGSQWNAYLGRITPITSVPQMTRGELVEILVPAQDDEDTESIREQVIASYNSRPFGGNRAQYIEFIENLDGVGGARPHRREGSVIDIFIITSEFTAPSALLIESVQIAVDPVQISGEGIGMAPFGHRVSIIGVVNQSIDVSVELELVDPWTWEEVKPEIETRINNYFVGLAEDWKNTGQTIVRIAELISSIVTLGGVLDVTDLKLNGDESNIILEEKFIPVLGMLDRII